MDIQSLRDDTPGCAGRIHLNNAGAALMPREVMKTVHDYIDLEGRIGGYEAQAASAEAIAAAYGAVADLVGADAGNIAFAENATSAFVQALSAIPFEAGDVILTSRNDYASSQIQFLSLQKRFGVEVIRAPDGPDGGVDVTAMTTLIDRTSPRLVCVAQVPTNSGVIQDVAAIGAACRDRNVLYLVDACQSVGQMPVNVRAIGCDFLAATARKFMRGPRGSGFLYVSDRVLDAGLEPLFIDMMGANWVAPDRYEPISSARRFENWEFAWALVLGTGAAARYASAVGLEDIAARVTALGNRVRKGLAAIPGVRVLHQGEGLCGIVTAALSNKNPAELVVELRQKNINTSAQDQVYAAIDYADRGAQAALRVSPHYYNTEQEIDQALAAIEELAGG